MIAVANRIYVHPKYADAFEARFQNRAGLVDEMEGFISNQVLRPTAEGDPYVVLTFWESREAFQNWVGSDAFKKGHARSGTMPDEAFPKESKLEIHDVISQSES